MFPGGGVGGKGYVWFSTTVKLILPLWRKPAKIKVHRNVTSAPPGQEESSEDSSQELCREKQPVLFIWMSVPWWVQTIFSALWDQNQNRRKQTKIPPPPNPREAARRNARSLTGHTDPGGAVNAACDLNAHPTSSPTPGFPVGSGY